MRVFLNARPLAMLLAVSLLCSVGCANFRHGWSQQCEVDSFWFSLRKGSSNETSPYWSSYAIGWKKEKQYWPGFDDYRRGLQAELDFMFGGGAGSP